MNTVEEIKKIVECLEESQEYLQLGDISQLIYPLQKLGDDEWEYLGVHINDWTDTQRVILTNAVLEIGDNKRSNYDSSTIMASSFILAGQNHVEVFIENLEFLNNGIPKDIELIDQVFEKIKWVEDNPTHYPIDFGKKYNLVNQLYVDGVIMKKSQ